MKTLIKQSLQTLSAALGLASGLSWHLSAIAQENAAELQGIPNIDASAVKAFSEISLSYNTWSAEAAVGAGLCLFFMLIFEN